MKKIILVLVLAVSMFSCDKESIMIEESNLTSDLSIYDEDDMGIYKGVFTTLDSELRGVVTISIVNTSSPVAVIKMTNGTTIRLESNTYSNGDRINDLVFTYNPSEDAYQSMSLNFTVSVNGNNPIVSNVRLNGVLGYISVIKEKSYSAVSPTTGTYTCVLCTQPTTFSAITYVENGQLLVSTQLIFNGELYLGSGAINGSCTIANGITTCPMGGSTVISSGTINWSGVVSFEPLDCTRMTGVWTKTPSGTGANGTFESDECL